MKFGKTLKIYVMGKDARSLKSVELVNWTGQAFVGRREHLALARKREELSEPAIYMLLGENADEGGAIDFYIGETDNFAERLLNHAQQKEWWSKFVVFVSKDKNLTKAHVKFLEAELYKLAQKSIGTLALKNSKVPSGASLPESDVSSMEEFLQNMIFVLESLGLSYFPDYFHEAKVEESKNIRDKNIEFYMTLPKDLGLVNDDSAKAILNTKDGNYILKQGSIVRKNPRESFCEHSYYGLWKQIVESDAVKENENKNFLTLSRDIEFRSPSAAGAVVRGGQTNGRTDWKRVGVRS